MLFTEIMKENKAFLKCYRQGRCVSGSFVSVYFRPNGLPCNRLGITAGKKQGNAVERNRIKRIFRASYRLNELSFPIGYDIVFVGRNDACEKTSVDTERFIKKRLLKEMLNPSKPFDKKGKKNGGAKK